MKELFQEAASKKETTPNRLVCIFLNGKEYEYAGEWAWELHSEGVYCSDVMLSFPKRFEGTKGLIHPDDKAVVLERTTIQEGKKIPFFQFRIITTYGEVKTLTGRNLQCCEVTALHYPEQEQQEEQEQLKTKAEALGQVHRLGWQKRAGELAERLTATGTWYLDADSHEMYYSDEVFRIYDLPRQSLNAHVHTFSPFIHPDDRETVTDAFTKALRTRVPLHLEYRIITVNGQEKLVRQSTHWEYNENGGQLLFGMVQDITEETALEQKAQSIQYDLALKNKVLQLNEQSTLTGHWHINLITRKVSYSDNVYRLHGLKPGGVPASGNVFFNHVHPEDRDLVQEVHKKIVQQHVPPDIDFRIIRNDGKLRHLRQRGKLVVHGESEMMMIITLQDISAEIMSGQKLAELKQHVTLRQTAQHQAERLAAIGSWVWEVQTDKIIWSENLFELLGQKPAGTELSQKHLLRAVYPEDRKKFTEALNTTVHEKQESNFGFRIFRNSGIREVSASFRLIDHGGKELFIGILQDITKDKQLQQELSAQVRQAAFITENMLDRAIISDMENTIQVWNRRCEEVYGLKRDAVLYKNFFDVFPDLKNEEHLGFFNRALNGETITIPHSKSTLRQEYDDLHIIPLKDENGAVTGLLHLLHDVTKEREMKQRLNERLNFIESLLEASVDRIIVMDRYMNYLYCNGKAAGYYGLRKEDLIGKNVLEVFPASINDPSYEHFRKALKGETVRIPAIEGFVDEHYYEVFLIPIKDESDEVSAVLWMHHDLGSEIKMRRQLRKSDEILNTINVIFIEVDHEFRFKYINPTAENYYNKTEEELFEKVIWDEFPQAVGTKGYDALIKACTDRVATQAEFFSPVFQKWVYMSATPSADGAIVLFYDRQDIWDTQQKLQEEHRRMKDAQAIGNIGSFEWNLGEEDVVWSDEMYRINGLEPGSRIFIEKTDALIHPDDYGDFKKLQARSIAAPGVYQITHRIVLHDGTVKHVSQQFESVADESGAVVRVHGAVQDITEQKQAEQEILCLKDEVAQQVTDKYLTLFNSIDQGFCIVEMIFDANGEAIDYRFLEANPVFEQQTGLKNVVGETMKALAPAHEEYWFRLYGEIAKTGEPKRFEQKAEHLAGGVWYEVYAFPFGNPEDFQVAILFDDITRRKNEEAHQALLLRLSDALRPLSNVKEIQAAATHIALNYFGADQCYYAELKANAAIIRQDATRSGVPSIIGTNDLSSYPVFTAMLNGGLPLVVPDVLTSEVMDETLKEFCTQANILSYINAPIVKNGRAVGLFCIIAGTTRQWTETEMTLTNELAERMWAAVERAKVEEALRQAEETIRLQQEDELFKNLNLLQQAEELGGMGSWEYKVAEDEISWSEGMYRLFDLKQGARVKKETYTEYAVKEDRAVAKAVLKKLQQGVETFEDTLTIKTKDGARKVLKVKGIAVKNAEGKPVRVLGVDVDITDLVKTEERLKALNYSLDQRNKELEAKNEELSSFSFIASHDLREPLRKIHTFSDWLLQRERENLSELGQNYLTRMTVSVTRMDRLIEDVLVLTKLQAAAFEQEEVDLNAVLNSAKAELAESIKLTKATVKGTKLPTITGNKAQLQHLFKNLISNAILFQKEGIAPQLTVKSSNATADEIVALGLNIENAYAKICFADNGIGFDKKYSTKIFQIFQRLHARTEYEGTGIGLTICKKVMENHHGAIIVESMPEKGATFCCYFPV